MRTQGYRWASEGDRTVLRLDPGATAVSTVVVDFPQSTDPLPKEYELFQPFSDGAVALYTGHFYATPVGPSSPDSAPALQTVRVVPPSGMHAIVRGQVTDGAVTFADSIGDGTYVYVGTGQPIETPHLIAVVDPGMPDWLRGMFEQRVPELFANYAQRFGAALPWKPVVLYSFHDTASTGFSSGGGTLTGLINMTLTGAAWRTPSSEAVEQAFYLLAHESAHLWNGQLVESAGGPASWMHEGSADAMANEMLLAFGIIDHATWRARREAAINQCATLVADASIHRAAARGMFRTYYDCGFVLAMWAEAALPQSTPDADLFSFWRDLVVAATSSSRRYDEALYFRVLQGLGVTDAVVAEMRAFLDANTVEQAIRGLANAGIDVRPAEGTTPAYFQAFLARQLFAHVMSEACGRISFHWGTPIVTVALPTCPPFRESIRVHGLEGFRLADQSVQAYDAVVAVCASGGTLRVQDEGGATIASVPCKGAPRPRPRWYQLRSN